MSDAGVWLVSRRFDLTVFLLPALAALGLAAVGPWIAPSGTTPVPMWLVAILMVDVAHVWSTIYRTYLDPAERARRPVLYVLTPIMAYVVGSVLHSFSGLLFWRALAYLAVWHFVRQQYGWIVLYARRAGDSALIDRALDRAAIYLATIFPLVWWHAHLPRQFEWFVKGDFIEGQVPTGVVDALWPVYVLALGLFLARQLQRGLMEGQWRPGKTIVVVTTAACWGFGIVAVNTDWAFTTTNVLIHGIPYLAIVWVYGERKTHREGSFVGWLFAGRHVLVFYALVVLLAYGEELAWDRLVWDDHPSLFPGPSLALGDRWLAFVVPLLALPQATHYLLDAFIWKTSKAKNPDLGSTMRLSEGLTEPR